MLLIRHAAQGPTGARWIQAELRSKDLVVMRERREGAVCDESFVPELAVGCPAIRYLLDGPLVAQVAGKHADLRAEEALVSTTFGTTPVRSLTMNMDVLHIVWRENGAFGSAIAHDVKLSPSMLAKKRLARLAELLTDGDTSPQFAGRALFDALAALRADGLPFRSAVDVEKDNLPTADEADVARAVERAIFPLSSQPTSIDLARELGVCEHHALRRTNRHFRRFYFCVKSWRECLRLRRLHLGALFMGRADARTEDVARVLGFRSATSFCHAFQDAGLPSPCALQRVLLAS